MDEGLAGAGIWTDEARAGHARLGAVLQGMEGVLVAFSGGVDSTLVTRAAADVLPGRCLAVTAVSPSLPRRERDEAARLAARIGAAHRFIETAELHDPRYAANPVNRCYFCKTELYDRLLPLAAAEGYPWVADGANTDDLREFRPGRQAARERGVRSPLVEAGLGKGEIRAISRALGLPTWDKPAMACLASRVPTGFPITIEGLGRIEAAEGALRDLGFRQVRVRHHGTMARIEVGRGELPRFLGGGLAEEVAARLKDLGYREVTVDPEGYRPGGANLAAGTQRYGASAQPLGTQGHRAPRSPWVPGAPPAAGRDEG